MELFLRIVEQAGGGWACCFGTRQHDVRTDLSDAIEHIKKLAPTDATAQLFIHGLDGTVQAVGEI
jgi:hypothetical protein